MKKLSKVQLIYWVIGLDVVSILLSVLLVLGNATQVQDSLAYQIVQALIGLCPPLLLIPLHRDFKRSLVWKGLSALLSLVPFFAGGVSLLIWKFPLMDVVSWLGIVCGIPAAFCFCQGFSGFTAEWSEGKFSKKWRNLGIARIVFGVLSGVEFVTVLFVNPFLSSANALLLLLLTGGLAVGTVILNIAQWVYTIQTARALKQREDGKA